MWQMHIQEYSQHTQTQTILKINEFFKMVFVLL